MSIFKLIYDWLLVKRTPDKTQSSESVFTVSKDITTDNKVKEFLDGKNVNLTAKDVFPDLKVFKPVKTTKDSTTEQIKVRLNNAKKSIPLPAAYEDACISMRMLIKLKIKEKKVYQSELQQLYRFACEYDLFYSEPYLEEIKEPSFNLSEVLKKSKLKSLEMPYERIGYNHLSLLNNNDIKLLVSEFGEPESHYDVRQYHKDIFDEAIFLLKVKREKEWGRFFKGLKKR